MRLAVTPEGQGVVLLPYVATARFGVVETVALVDTTRLLANSSERASLTVLVDRVGNPVDTSITADSLVLGVNQDDLEVLVCGVLVHPVRIQYTQVRATAADTVLGSGPELALVLKLVNTLVSGLTVGNTLRSMTLTTTTTHTNAVDHIALLGLVAETTCLIRAGWTGSPVNNVQLTVLPAADTLQEAKDIALLVTGKLFKVFVGTHDTV